MISLSDFFNNTAFYFCRKNWHTSDLPLSWWPLLHERSATCRGSRTNFVPGELNGCNGWSSNSSPVTSDHISVQCISCLFSKLSFTVYELIRLYSYFEGSWILSFILLYFHFQPYDIQDECSLRKVMKHSNVVINLVGRDVETRYERMNVLWRNL